MGPEEIHYEAEGVNYTDYEPNTGIGTDIDIKYKYEIFNIIRHVGLIGVKVTKRTTENAQESAVGRYYHKYIAFLPNGSLGFSPGGTSGSISISWEKAYDKAPDAGCAFDAISQGVNELEIILLGIAFTIAGAGCLSFPEIAPFFMALGLVFICVGLLLATVGTVKQLDKNKK